MGHLGDLVNEPATQATADRCLGETEYRPGGRLAIQADGYTAGASVDIRVDAPGGQVTIPVTTVTADETGSINATATLPAGLQPGSYLLEALGQNDDGSPQVDLNLINITNDPCPYQFSGFFSPVNNQPTVNTAKAGSAIPVKFSLHGIQAADIFATGSPSSQRIDCISGATLDPIEQTVSAGASSLQYDLATDTYTYVWKTNTAWAGTCRRLTVILNDGSAHAADFKLRS